MKPELKARWIAALRSGNYKQTSSTLHSDNGYCCLGVACAIFAEEAGVQVKQSEWNSTLYDEHCDVLPEKLAEYLDIDAFGTFDEPIDEPRGTAETLIDLNDDMRYDFNQIADVIEKQF